MAQLKKFGFTNFKCFKGDVDFDFCPITIFTGTNSSGKSSVNKALKVIKESINTSNMGWLDSKDETLGNMDTFINDPSKDLKFRIPMRWHSVNQSLTLHLSYKKATTDIYKSGLLDTASLVDNTTEEEVFRKYNSKSKKSATRNTMAFEERYINITLLRKKLNFAFENVEIFLKSVDEIKKLMQSEVFYAKWFKEIEYPENLTDIQREKLQINHTTLKKSVTLINYFNYEIYEDRSLGHFQSRLNLFKINLEGNNSNSKKDKKLIFRDVSLQSWASKKDHKFSKYVKFENIYNYELPIFDYSFLTKEYIQEHPEDLATILKVENEYPYFDLRYKSVSNANQFFGSPLILGFDLNHTEQVYEKLKGNIKYNIKISEIKKGKKFELFTNFVSIFISNLDEQLTSSFKDTNLNFIPSIRSIPSRIISRNNPTNYLEKNAIEGVKIVQGFRDPQSNKKIKVFRKWLKEFDISEDVEILPIEATGLNTIKLVINGQKRDLVDVGFGYSQLLPIIIECTLLNDYAIGTIGDLGSESGILIIEEPETNLHPALQSKLADFFVEVRRDFGLQLIIETHSEYLIRRMQYLVGTKKLCHKDANIYYFNKPKHLKDDDKQVFRINFKENGLLDKDFGPGFTDESDRLALDLYRLNKGQKTRN